MFWKPGVAFSLHSITWEFTPGLLLIAGLQEARRLWAQRGWREHSVQETHRRRQEEEHGHDYGRLGTHPGAHRPLEHNRENPTELQAVCRNLKLFFWAQRISILYTQNYEKGVLVFEVCNNWIQLYWIERGTAWGCWQRAHSRIQVHL